MLRRLYISNFALIEEMDVAFPGALTVITGETGAGKSIFLDALALALGRRADLSVLRNKARKCVVEAEFEVKGLALDAITEGLDLGSPDEIVLRREIGSDGRSRSFVNDALVGLAELKALGAQLVDIHSQHQTLQLTQGAFQLEMTDVLAGVANETDIFRQKYRALRDKESALAALQQEEAAARKELDYLEFLSREFEAVKIENGRLATLEAEAMMIENAGQIKSVLAESADALVNSDGNLTGSLSRIKQSLQSLSRFGQDYVTLAERLGAAVIELKDVSDECERLSERLGVDASRLEMLNAEIDVLNRLLKKHGVRTEAELLSVRDGVDAKLLGFSSLESRISALEKEVAAERQQCEDLAAKISAKRKKSCAGIEKLVLKSLASLSMEKAEFRISIEPAETMGPSGSDTVRFLFSANPGMPVSDVSKVASGGELSRLMLSLKSLLATRKKLPTIIFDEIDTGVSGEVADRIGNILVDMSEKMQVITITHLAQMASKGTHHLFVYKKNSEKDTISYIRELQREERITEIAKMLSTGTPTPSAVTNAKELLNLN